MSTTYAQDAVLRRISHPAGFIPQILSCAWCRTTDNRGDDIMEVSFTAKKRPTTSDVMSWLDRHEKCQEEHEATPIRRALDPSTHPLTSPLKSSTR